MDFGNLRFKLSKFPKSEIQKIICGILSNLQNHRFHLLQSIWLTQKTKFNYSILYMYPFIYSWSKSTKPIKNHSKPENYLKILDLKIFLFAQLQIIKSIAWRTIASQKLRVDEKTIFFTTAHRNSVVI